MPKAQQWITCLDPEYLLNKYCGEDKVEKRVLGRNEDGEETSCNIWSKWKTGLVHGDPFEERAVVLDPNSLPFAKSSIDLVQTPKALREHFIQELRKVMQSAASNPEPDPVLILAFCHGDYETGGLLMGVSPDDNPDSLVAISDVALVLAEYPQVKVTIFMTSCYSGHWVVSREFSHPAPTIMAATKKKQESHAFGWSSSLRHAGGAFTGAFLNELLKEPDFEDIRSGLPEDVPPKTARTYESMTHAVLAEAHRLCLPENIPGFGSTPVFTTEGAHDKFWKRTEYSLHDYKKNYDKLPKIPCSDPHPKYDRKTIVDGMIDDDDPRVVEWEKRNPNWMAMFHNADEFADATGGYGSTMRGLHSSVNMRYLIRQYMLSKPGSDTSSWGIYVKGKILQFHMGKLTPTNTAKLRRLLMFRLQMNDLADQFVRILNIDTFPPISQWEIGHQKLYGDHLPEAEKIMDVIMESGIFSRPKGRYGMPGPSYQKPTMYLAYAMLESNINAEVAKDLIDQVKHLRFGADPLAEEWKRTAFAQKSIKRLREVLDDAWKESKHRSKRARPSLQSTGWMDGLLEE